MNNQDKTTQSITPNLPLWSYELKQDSKLAVKTRRELEIHLITKSFEDEEFKHNLLANPKAIIEKELGTTLPKGIEIKVFEETETTFYIVLPRNPYEVMSELELDANLGLTLEDVAQWVYEQQGNALLEEHNAIRMISRTWKDYEFKQKLLTNPKILIEKEIGQELAQDIEIKVLVETVDTLYIVLPRLADDINSLLNFSTPFPLIADSALLVVGSGHGGCSPCNQSSIRGNTSKSWVCSNNSMTQSCKS